MDDRKALMAAILANADDDTPRLVYADWLQEHGDEHDQARAEFIRLQIEAERLPERDKQRKKLESRAGQLAREHHEPWLAPLTAFVYGLSTDPKLVGRSSYLELFSRGLLRELYVEDAKFVQAKYQKPFPDALAAVGLEQLNFYSPPRPVTARRAVVIAASPVVRWVARLGCHSVDDAMLEAFGTSPHFAHLSAFEFETVRIGDAGLKAFARTTNTARLQRLSITTRGTLLRTKAEFTATGVLALLNSPRLPALTALDVTGIPAAQLEPSTLLADPSLARLTGLRLDVRVALTDVIACPHLTNLHSLRLDDTDLADRDAEALLASPTFAKLIKLTLWTRGALPRGFKTKLAARFGENLWLREQVS